MPEGQYVILKAVHPSWCTMQLPGEVAELLGCSRETLQGLNRPARSIAFLSRGAGTVRVVGFYRSTELLAREMSAKRLLAMAQLTEKLVFNIPGAVEEHIAMRSYSKSTPGTRGTDDMVVWFMPEEEYYDYRAQTRTGGAFKALSTGSLPKVYLTKSLFANLRKGLVEEAHPLPLLAVHGHGRS